jgi:hypothetical protein
MRQRSAIVKRIWAGDDRFDHEGTYYQLRGVEGAPRSAWSHGLVKVGGDLLLDLVAAQAQRMVRKDRSGVRTGATSSGATSRAESAITARLEGAR